MSDIKHLSHNDVVEITAEKEYPRNPYASGYGRKVPTNYLLKLKNGRTYRVYVMIYGNSGSAYITQKGETLFLESETEYALQNAIEGAN